MKKRIIILSAIILLAGLVGFSLAVVAVDFKAGAGGSESFFRLYLEFLKKNGLFLGLVWIGCVLLICIATSFVFAPLRSVSHGNNLKNAQKYKELASVFDRLSYLETSLRDSDRLLNRLDSGVLIMTSATDVALINRFAAKLLGYRGDGKLSYFVRDEELLGIIRSGRDTRVYRREMGAVYSLNFEFGSGLTVLITDITVLTRAEADREKLVAALNEVVAPLSTISGYAELIRGGMKEQNVKDAAAVICDEVRRISSAAKRTLSK